MKKLTKIWIITAASLVIVGLILFSVVMAQYRWDFNKLSTVKFETNIYEITDDFTDISVNTDTDDIIFALSDNGKCIVECYEEEKTKHSVSVRDNTLIIDVIDERDWHDHINIGFFSPKITVYLPESEYSSLSIDEKTGDIELPKELAFENVDISLSTGDVNFYASASERIKIKASTGNICLDEVNAGELDLTVSTGKITISDVICENDVKVNVSTGRSKLTDVKCKNVISSGSTGDISLKNVIAVESFYIKRSTGDVEFKGCDAAEILVKTDTGDIKGSLLTGKVFVTQTDTGRINVPKTMSGGGKCEITTDTGDIKIDISQ